MPCIIARQIFASFPLSKFDIVVEYGGSFISSQMMTICSKMAISPPIYFLNIKLEDHSIPKELCEGFDIFKENDFKMVIDCNYHVLRHF